MKSGMKLGKNSESRVVKCDVPKLIDTRLLIQGSSGSGKSWLIRLLCERASKDVPIVVLDLEGEFVTLREKVDLVIAGEGGEVDVDVRSAGLLARKLLDLRLSAVVDLFDLTWPQRRAYVRAFLESMMAAPRDLWGPRLVVLDEGHAFAPESSKSEALGAVIDVASRGRKRGYCLAVATQRLSKLHKDVAAELRNVAIGQTTLDVDVKRGLDVLGMPADLDHKRRLRGLDHEFYAFGPALSFDGVELVRADAVATSHPESGSRRDLAPPSPSRRIAGVLKEFAELPEKAIEEAKTLAESQARVRELERQLKAGKVDPAAIEKAVAAAEEARDRHWQGELSKLETARDALARRIESARDILLVNGEASVAIAAPPKTKATARPAPRPAAPANTPRRPAASSAPDGLTKAERAILIALYWLRDEQATPAKVGFYAGYRHKSGSFNNALGKLRNQHSYVSGWAISPEGAAVAAELANPKPDGRELRDWLRPRLNKAENQILDVLISACGQPLDNEDIAARTESSYSSNSGSFNNALGTLRKLEAAVGYAKDGGVRAADVFFTA